jgi:hypothetical protein
VFGGFQKRFIAEFAKSLGDHFLCLASQSYKVCNPDGHAPGLDFVAAQSGTLGIRHDEVEIRIVDQEGDQISKDMSGNGRLLDLVRRRSKLDASLSCSVV